MGPRSHGVKVERIYMYSQLRGATSRRCGLLSNYCGPLYCVGAGVRPLSVQEGTGLQLVEPSHHHCGRLRQQRAVQLYRAAEVARSTKDVAQSDHTAARETVCRRLLFTPACLHADRSGLVVACVYHDSHCDIQPWAPAGHPYCSF